MFSALRHRNFRVYLTGQSISLIGTWMQQLATGWMVYRLTQSPLWLGISMFSTQVPMFLFGWMAGVWVDRTDKRRLLLWTQGLAALQATVLATLALSGRITITELILLNLFGGCINAVEIPARQSFVVHMIGRREDLPNAIALNSSVMNGTRLVGPAIGGFMIAAFGEGPCFLLNALSYVAVLGALSSMKIDRGLDARKNRESFRHSLRTGIRAAYGQPQIRAMLLFLGYLSVVGLPYNTLFPALAAHMDSGGATTLGALTATAGFGALTGAMYLARRGKVVGLTEIAGYSALVFSLSLIASAWAHPKLLALACIYVTGLSMMTMLAAGNTVVQTLVDDDKRGRVMALFAFALLGTAPFGSLLSGWLAHLTDLSWALTINGVLSGLGTAAYLGRPGRHEHLARAAESAAGLAPSPSPPLAAGS